MRINRDMSVCAVAAAAKAHPVGLPPMRCLDAFAASGVLGLRWAVEAAALAAGGGGGGLDVVLNDASGRCAAMAAVNAEAAAATVAGCVAAAGAGAAGAVGPNPTDVPPAVETPNGGPHPMPRTYVFQGVDSAQPPPLAEDSNAPPSPPPPPPPRATVSVTRRMAGALLHEEVFNFVHLDPFGGAAPHLDAALARAPHCGTLSVTSTDTAALYGIYPAVTKRHYGAATGGGGAGNPARPPWFRELGVRILLGAVARAAARHDRGITPLSAMFADHFVQIVVRVSRGAAAADRSVDLAAGVGPLWHCELCDVAAAGGAAPCPHADALGPGWLGPLGDATFLRDMAEAARGGGMRGGKDQARDKSQGVARETTQGWGHSRESGAGAGAGAAGDVSSAGVVESVQVAREVRHSDNGTVGKQSGTSAQACQEGGRAMDDGAGGDDSKGTGGSTAGAGQGSPTNGGGSNHAANTDSGAHRSRSRDPPRNSCGQAWISTRVVRLIDQLAGEVAGPPLFRVVTKYADGPGAAGPPPMDELVRALVAAVGVPQEQEGSESGSRV